MDVIEISIGRLGQFFEGETMGNKSLGITLTGTRTKETDTKSVGFRRDDPGNVIRKGDQNMRK